MNPLITKLVAGTVAIALLVAAFFYVRELRAELADAQHQRECANQGIAARDTTIGNLQENAADKGKQQQQLDVSTLNVQTKLAAARQEIRKVINENPTVSNWADTALPADIARLSASPAYTGANDFSSTVPADKPLHAAGDGTAH
jgi:LysB family phage lysis regulatory protein